ncbi:hypothetical protein PYW07_012611 [Mythimna separata]|uniref:Uncharacterized protein n=1 Tax=Mythimna separata TaxID=271217 RepID=A0AAD7Y8B0_MYTSE|nr:hypothetical protein PYW07_012611 [Mythimna separata]
MRCSVKDCTNDTRKNNKSHGITFHMFPKQPHVRTAWVEALGLPDDWQPKERSSICSEHFRRKDFYVTAAGLRRIKCGAVPVVGGKVMTPKERSSICSEHFRRKDFYVTAAGLRRIKCGAVPMVGGKVMTPKKRSSICSEHFRRKDFYVTAAGLRRIKCGAVPVVGGKVMTEPNVELDAPAALRVCRICLVMDTKMYHIKEHKLDLMFEQLTGLMARAEDRLPQRVCWECATRLNSAFRFKSKAVRSDVLLHDTLRSDSYIKIRDIKSINRKQNNLISTLVTQTFENDDFDLRIKHLTIKSEETQAPTEIVPETSDKEEIDVKSLAPIHEIDVKDESSNEIFFDEYDHFDDDDDKALSEVYVEKKEAAPKVKKKREKGSVDRERRRVKKSKHKKVEEESDPNTCSDKYKTTDVKRRRNNESFDESLFTVTPLTYDQQIEEILKRQESYNYTSAPYKCTVCYRGFQIKDRFTAHSVRHSEQCGAYECFICKTRLKTSRALRKHLTAQHTEQYSCKGCPFVTRNRGVAREHEKWHAGTKYQCPHCASEFDKITTYMGHIRIKHVSDFVCELCGYTFVSKKGIDVHKKKKHRMYNKEMTLEGPYCEMCDVKFLSQDAHDRHLKLSSRHSSDHDPNRIRNDSQSMNAERSGRVMRRIERRPVIHPRLPTDEEQSDSAPVNCEQCGLQLRDLRVYAQHFRRMHPDKNRTKYPAMKTPCMCEQCGKIFQSMALLKDHMWIHTGEKRFKCDRCTKSFTQKTNLVFHMRVHSASRPSYECPLCGKHFAFFNNRRRHMFKTNLVFHMRVHSASRPSYECPLCGKHFAFFNNRRRHMFKTNLVFHMRVHSASRPSYECPLCGKHFAFFNNRRRHMFKTNLVFHMRVHSASRPSYECPLCGKHFAFFNNRRRHMFIHTGLKPFKCDTCGKSFTTAGEHRAHVEHVHMKKPWPKRARHRNSDWKCDEPSVED